MILISGLVLDYFYILVRVAKDQIIIIEIIIAYAYTHFTYICIEFVANYELTVRHSDIRQLICIEIEYTPRSRLWTSSPGDGRDPVSAAIRPTW